MKKLSREFILTAVKNNTLPEITVKSSVDAAVYSKSFYSDDIDIYESAFIILINRSNKTLGWAKISQGGVSGTIIDTKIVCKYAVEALASAIIIVHNHPSGSINPSQQDHDFTNKLKQACSVLDITLLDSLIITSEDGRYYSFADNGEL